MLNAYRITYENGSSYVTSVAATATEADVKEYFLGRTITLPDEKTTAKIVKVEKVD